MRAGDAQGGDGQTISDIPISYAVTHGFETCATRIRMYVWCFNCSSRIPFRRTKLASQRDIPNHMIQQSIQKIWVETVLEVYPQAPIEEVRVFATRAINSYIKEYERILAMPVEDLTLSDKKLKNSKAHYKVISSNHVKIPSNWRVYIAVISTEEIIKAHLLIQGRRIKGHDYLTPLVRNLRWGEAKRRIRAVEQFADSVGNRMDINAKLDAALTEINSMRNSGENLAKASSKDIREILQLVTELKQSFDEHFRNDLLAQKMRSKMPSLARIISSGNPSLERFLEFQFRNLANSPLTWYPIDIDFLLLGAVLDPHKNRTRYVDEHDGSIGPDRYGRESPLGVVKQFGGLLALLKSVQDRTAQKIRNIKEQKSSD